MKCPKCKEETTFSLFETADDFLDGVVECDSCGEQVATFNYTVIIPEIEE